jgi:hypothetical protein
MKRRTTESAASVFVPKGNAGSRCYTEPMVIRKPAPKKRPAAQRSAAKPKRERSIWAKVEALGRSIPAAERSRHPHDGARNIEHYLYGGPKQDPD